MIRQIHFKKVIVILSVLIAVPVIYQYIFSIFKPLLPVGDQWSLLVDWIDFLQKINRLDLLGSNTYLLFFVFELFLSTIVAGLLFVYFRKFISGRAHKLFFLLFLTILQVGGVFLAFYSSGSSCKDSIALILILIGLVIIFSERIPFLLRFLLPCIIAFLISWINPSGVFAWAVLFISSFQVFNKKRQRWILSVFYFALFILNTWLVSYLNLINGESGLSATLLQWVAFIGSVFWGNNAENGLVFGSVGLILFIIFYFKIIKKRNLDADLLLRLNAGVLLALYPVFAIFLKTLKSDYHFGLNSPTLAFEYVNSAFFWGMLFAFIMITVRIKGAYFNKLFLALIGILFVVGFIRSNISAIESAHAGESRAAVHLIKLQGYKEELWKLFNASNNDISYVMSKIAMFKDDHEKWIGMKFSDLEIIDEKKEINGSFDEILPSTDSKDIPKDTWQAILARGWLYEATESFNLVVLVDQNGYIVGIGYPNLQERQDVADYLKDSKAKNSGWIGFLKAEAMDMKTISAYALNLETMHAYKLRNEIRVNFSSKKERS